MHHSHPRLAVALVGFAGILTASLPAQVTLRAVNAAGFAYVDSANNTVVKNYAKNTNFVKTVGLYAYPKGGYMNAKVQHWRPTHFGIETTCRLMGSYKFKSGRTTGATTGAADAQKFELAIKTTKPTLVILNLSFLANIYGRT